MTRLPVHRHFIKNALERSTVTPFRTLFLAADQPRGEGLNAKSIVEVGSHMGAAVWRSSAETEHWMSQCFAMHGPEANLVQLGVCAACTFSHHYGRGPLAPEIHCFMLIYHFPSIERIHSLRIRKPATGLTGRFCEPKDTNSVKNMETTELVYQVYRHHYVVPV